MIRSQIIEITEDRRQVARGDYEFVELPMPGDRIVLGNASGDMEMFRVVRRKHAPIRAPHDRFETAASAKVYVEWVEPWNERD
jgi:hypothetical protein